MAQQININKLSLLMSESSMNDTTKAEIKNKLNNLLNFMEHLTESNNNKYDLSNIKNLLLNEQKSAAKIIVSKNNCISKDLIKSMASQKESLLQVIEISQLRLEAELTKLNSEMSYPVKKIETSFFNKMFGLFKIPFKNMSTKKSVAALRTKISTTTDKLNDLEKQKEDLSKNFGTTGTEALKYLNKITYNSFLPVSDISSKNIHNIKNKITVLK